MPNSGIIIKSMVFEDCHITLWTILGNSSLPSKRYNMLAIIQNKRLELTTCLEESLSPTPWIIIHKKRLAHRPTKKDDTCASFWEITCQFVNEESPYKVEIQASIASNQSSLHRKQQLPVNILAQIITTACADFFDITVSNRDLRPVEINQI